MPFARRTRSPGFSFPSAGPPSCTEAIWAYVVNGTLRAPSAAATASLCEVSIWTVDCWRTAFWVSPEP